ncbi:unnamed protein product [Discosporangium mesarthrocarpum]
MSHSHRAGSLRQDNKKHKTGSHQSKRARKVGLGSGRVELGGAGARRSGVKEDPGTSKKNAKIHKLNHINHVNQLRKQKREDIWLEKRLGTNVGAPKVCVWVCLSGMADPATVQASVLKDCTRSTEPTTGVEMLTASFSKFKQRFTFVTPDRDLQSVLEFAKVADLLLVVLPVGDGQEGCVDEEGEMMLTSLKAMGLSSVVGLVQGLDLLKNGKQQSEMRKWAQRFFDTEFAGLAKVVDSSNPAQVLRALTTTPARTIHWRSIRSYMLADSAEIIPPRSGEKDCMEEDDVGDSHGPGGGSNEWRGSCTLRLRGYIRGRPLGVNQLVHLCDAGTFRMRRIYSCPEPCPLKRRHQPKSSVAGPVSGVGGAGKGGGEIDHELLAEADPEEREDMAMEADVDGLAGEQTWPTEEELAFADAAVAEARAANEETSRKGEVEGEVEGGGKGGRGGRGAASASKKRPKGWSEYQSVWLAEGGGDGGEDREERGGDCNGMDMSGEEDWDNEDDEEDEDEDEDLLREGMGIDAAAREQEERRRRAVEAARDDTQFPDEVDTPGDRAARERFARYRALRSFRTSPWDPKESLPEDYARIFQFEDFAAIQKEVLGMGQVIEHHQNQQLLGAKAERSVVASSSRSRASSFARGDMHVDEEGMGALGGGEGTLGELEGRAQSGGSGALVPSAMSAQARVSGHEGFISSGAFVEVEVEGVSADLLERRRLLRPGGRDWPLLFFSLLQHEHRLSVVHFNVRRDPRYEDPVPSKERLVLQCGFRRWSARPAFSQANLNCDKHKYERFLHPDRFAVLSAYGPTTFQPSPVLVFKETGGEGDGDGQRRMALVATGTLLGVDPDRIVLKKIVLTGYPIRVQKRRAVIKHMFHAPEDVRWFKPAELTTKYGLTGHIKEPVGTHGLMKVIFNKAVTQNDTVCLNLYKRVYPKMVGGQVVVT